VKKLLLVLIAVMCIAGTVNAAEANPIADAQKAKLGFTYDFSYMSKWMSRGSEVYSENGAFFNTISADLWGSGFTAGVTHVNADGGSFVDQSNKFRPSDKQRFNYFVAYSDSILDDSVFKTKYKFTYMYKDWYRQSSSVADYQVWVLGFAFPKLIGNGFTPKYIMHYDSPAGSGYNVANKAGFVHRFGLDYKLKVDGLPFPVILSSEAAYRDGWGGPSMDHDWSHATFGIGTKFNIAGNLSFHPAIYHQITMDNTINSNDDVTYCKLSLKYKF
jgi:hypothetical protein